MATVRYRVHGVPDQWVDAFFPMPTLTPAGATSVSRFTYGAPGTYAVPLSDNHNASGTLSSNPAWAPPSHVAPDYFLPQLYVNDIRELGPTVRYLPQRVAPIVPPVTPIGAHGPLGPSDVAMGGRKVGGLRSMFWPRARLRWPVINEGTTP